MNRTLASLFLALGTLFAGTQALAQICPAGHARVAPDSRYTRAEPVTGERVVTDTVTGLMWKECAEGQTDAGCGGGAMSSMTWSDALAAARSSTWAGYEDWRMPNIIELRSLVETGCHSPSINTNYFPNTWAGAYWSSTSYRIATYARGVLFQYGDLFANTKTNGDPVRLVRGGQGLDSFDAANTHVVTAASAGNGTITPAHQVVIDGGAANFTVTPATGHHVASVAGEPCTPQDDGGGHWSAANVQANCAVTATFAINSYTLSFDTHGGSAVAPITADYGSSVTLPSAPTLAGYSFAHWNEAADGSGTAHAAGAAYIMPAADTTLHAIWGINDAAISKRVTDSLAWADGSGDRVRFEVLVGNDGEAAIINAGVLDLLPSQFSLVTWACTGINGGICANASGIDDINELVNLPVGGGVRFVIEGWVAGITANGMANTAMVVSDNDSEPSNDESTARYQRCSASNHQANPGDTTLLPYRCVFVGGFEQD